MFKYKIFKKVLQNYIFEAFIILLLEWLAFHKIFSFWFYHGWEASWLIGNTNGVFNLETLMRSHGFISALNLKLFGWNPQGWFATAFLFHFLVTMIVIISVSALSKNKLVGFISGIVFLATTSDHDVITWGSFESLYAAQTFGFYIMLLLYINFKKTKKIVFYLASLFFFAASSVLRESGLLFIPLLFLLEIFFYQNDLVKALIRRKKYRKRLVVFLKLQLPFWLLGIAYLVLRASYGGSPYDYIDQRVQFRILLMNEHRYFEYIWYGILSFGQYLPPYIIPYPILNAVKTFIYSHLPFLWINNYFFVIIGWIFYFCFLVILWYQRKSKYKNYLFFLLSAFTVIILFYCFAWTSDESFLSLLYSWSENRWRYFAYTALAPFLTISVIYFIDFLIKKFHTKIFIVLGVCLLLLSVSTNIFILNIIESQMYWENHYPSIQFYKTLTKELPHINTKTRFYYYRNSPSLNDYLSEFYFIKQRFYPKLTSLPTDWVRSQMFYPVKYLSEGKLDTSNFYFIDFSPAEGVVNKTAQVLSLFKNQKNIDLTSTLSTDQHGTYLTPINTKTPVEFPSWIKINLSLSPTSLIKPQSQKPLTNGQFNALSSFIKDEVSFMHNTKVSVCKTMDNQINEEFHNYTPSNISDGNMQDRSRWWADCRPAWVVFDLGKNEDIAGFLWGSYNAIDYVPRDYKYQVSQDGKTWKTVDIILGNNQAGRLDKLPHSVNARFVRFMANETIKRGMLALNEFSVIPSDDVSLFDSYSNPQSLFNDMYNFWYKLTDFQWQQAKSDTNLYAFVPFIWTTSPNNNVDIAEQTYYVPIVVDGENHEYTFELPESELYSTEGQFLKRFFNSLTFSVPFDTVGTQVLSLQIIPMFPYKNKL